MKNIFSHANSRDKVNSIIPISILFAFSVLVIVAFIILVQVLFMSGISGRRKMPVRVLGVKMAISPSPTQSATPTPTPSVTPTPTPTPVVQPSIFNIQASGILTDRVTITFNTNIPSSAKVWYGTVDTVQGRNLQVSSASVQGTSHTATLFNLQSGTKYYYSITAQSGSDPSSSVQAPSMSVYTVFASTPTPTPTPSPSATPVPTPTATPTPTPTPTPSVSPTPVFSASPTPTPSVTPTPTPTPTASATPTPTPTPAPTATLVSISDITLSNITSNSVNIKWNSNLPASGYVIYSENSSVPSGSPYSQEFGEYKVAHSLSLTGLKAQTKYYFKIDSWVTLSNRVVSEIRYFTTLAVSQPNVTPTPTPTPTSNCKTIVSTSPTICTSLDTATPASRVLSAGEKNIVFAKIKFSAANSDVTPMNGVHIGTKIVGADKKVSNIRIYKGDSLLGSATGLSFNGSYYYAWVYPDPKIVVPANSSIVITIMADITNNALGEINLGVFGYNFDEPGAISSQYPLEISGSTFTIINNTVTDETTKFLRGDVNGDGKIDVTDMFNLSQYINEGALLGCADGADVNDDGQVDISDFVYWTGWFMRGGDEPKAPGTKIAGIDPTADNITCGQYSIQPAPQPTTLPSATPSSSPTPKPSVSPTPTTSPTPTSSATPISSPTPRPSVTPYPAPTVLPADLVKLKDKSTVYLVDGNTLRPFINESTFYSYGYSFKNVRELNSINAYSIESPMPYASVNTSSVVFRRGDINADGNIDVSDDITMAKWSNIDRNYPCDDAADVNDDGKIDISDQAYFSAWQNMGGPEPKNPGPNTLGVDSTPDSLGCSQYPKLEAPAPIPQPVAPPEVPASQPMVISGTKFLRGDVNGDGRIDITDMFNLSQYINESVLLGCADGADVNDDGTVDISDFVYWTGWFNRGEAEPKAPGTKAPGTDPTLDTLGCGQNAEGMVQVAIASDPRPALVIGGTTTNVGKFSMKALNDTMDINQFGFSINSPDGGIVGNEYNINTFELWEEGGTSALGSVAVNWNHATITPIQIIAIEKNIEKNYIVKARWANLITNTKAQSGSGLRIQLSHVDARGRAIDSPSSAKIIGLGQKFNTFSVFKSLPTVSMATVSNKISGNAVVMDLMKFNIKADAAGPIGVAKFTFQIATTTVSLSNKGFYLYESSNPTILGNNLANTNDFHVVTTNAGSIIEARFDVNNDDPSSRNQPGLTEDLIISAGTMRYFTLQGSISGGHDAIASNESIATSLLGDSWFASTKPVNIAGIDGSAEDDLIWSDLNFDQYSSSTATQTAGWFNGYRVPGIENTTSTPQVVTD